MGGHPDGCCRCDPSRVLAGEGSPWVRPQKRCGWRSTQPPWRASPVAGVAASIDLTGWKPQPLDVPPLRGIVNAPAVLGAGSSRSAHAESHEGRRRWVAGTREPTERPALAPPPLARGPRAFQASPSDD
jgi:hypothetical protein